MEALIACDIGGTQLRVATFDAASGEMIQQKRIPTQAAGETAVDRLTGLIGELWPTRGHVRAIGAAAPGFVDPEMGIIYVTPNIPGWNGLPLRQILEDRFDVPVFVGNDANLAALGEWRFGAGRGFHHVLYLTISTGIGGGIVNNDRLLQGARGLAAELGHITVEPNGPICGCGKRGHLEALASGTGISNYVAEKLAAGAASTLLKGPHPSAKEISQAAAQGDPLALKAIQRAGTYIGHALADFLHLFNPSIVIIGGGVSKSGEMLLAPMRIALNERVISPEYVKDLQIVNAMLGDDCGLMGALALAKMDDHI
ncbi:transcriptional regulator/sugar kinase [Longilinea arvoryzae]|uniref:Transcriptional regulator/sugar kinase n=1 Tax=Longilinea arvoryzae TaxID=360412 RepID=A0A0S7B9Q5_9CHLR|nr:ROK family protein [Longilinea arvoryzae]GAP14239.1 transcriptional regulator/sugar kinase [Longilinea arvoryzae]